MQVKRQQNGFAVLELVLILVVLAILGFTGWFVYHSRQAADKTYSNTAKDMPQTVSTIKTFADCQKSPGSKILTTYPEQCITTGGKMFSDTLKYLVIKEWGVKFPITNDETELTYRRMNPESSTQPIDGFDILSPSVAKLCGTGGDGTFANMMRISVSDPNTDLVAAYKKELGTRAVRLGNYYYLFGGTTNECNDIGGPKEATLSSNLQSEFQKLTPN